VVHHGLDRIYAELVRRVCTQAALLLFARASLRAQPSFAGDRNLSVNVDLVLVPVVVTDHSGTTIAGLPASSFSALENNTPRPIVSLTSEDLPASIGIIVDLSGSMSGKAGMAARAMRAFFGTSNPEDEALLLTVSSLPGTLSGFTKDFGSLSTAILAARPRGATALIDTVYLGLRQMRAAHCRRKALLIISDGMDNHSRYSEQELMRIADETDVAIFTIGIIQVPPARKLIALGPERNGLAFLDRLAARTGGLSFTLGSYADPSPVAEKIGRAIRDQYLIGFRPSADGSPGQWHAIQVKVSVPQVRVSSRPGFYNP
jgi:Ca-activated chloride channel family protein